ncbi:hypothetical protein ACWD0J_03600 [Streptomyces sp. NPDC003011]
MFRADLRAAGSWRYRPGDVVRAPLRGPAGEDDDLDGTAVDAWHALSTGAVTPTRLTGGRFRASPVRRGLPRHLTAFHVPA